MWTKYADTTILESADWTNLLRGDTISGDVTITVVGGLTCTATVVNTTGNESTIRIQGGVTGESGFLLATITTAGGQTLKDQQPLKIIARPTVVA